MSTETDNLCRQCGAKCCRYFCFEIDRPETFEEFENLRWFLLHERIGIHVDEGKWFISIDNPCRNLTPDGLCSDYQHRPRICRTYSIDGCDATTGDYEYEEIFTAPEQIVAYARKAVGERKYDKKWAKLCGLPKPKKAEPRAEDAEEKTKKKDKKKDKGRKKKR